MTSRTIPRQVGTDSLDIAVIGLGAVAEPHLAAYQKLSNVRICGGVEPRPERRSDISNRYGLRTYATCAELLAEQQPQVACVLTPVGTHRQITEQCAAAGIHVLCEKPMAVRPEDAIAMSEACRGAGVQFFYGSSYRCLPAVRAAKALLDAGSIGNVRLIVEELMGGTGAANYRPMSAVHYPDGGPGGSGWGLVDHGIHMIDIFPWLCNSRVSAVLGRGDRTGKEPRPEFALLTLESGASGVLLYESSTWPAELPTEGVFSSTPQWLDGSGWTGETGLWDRHPGNIRIYGTEGSLRIFHYANKLYLNRDGGQREMSVPEGSAPMHFGRQLLDFWRSLARNESPATSAQDGIRALLALDAIYRSEAEGRWQLVTDDHAPL